jgi:hypothetical protein
MTTQDDLFPPDNGLPGADGNPPPAWLEALLRQAAEPSSAFLAACERGSESGYTLLKLRRVSPLMEGTLVSAPEFLRGLSAAARVSLASAARWAGLPEDLRINDAFARGWGRLARSLGWDPRGALLRLRLALAEEAGSGLFAPTARVEPMGASAETAADLGLDDYESALARESATWAPDLVDRLHSYESAFREAYATASAGE